MSEEPFKVMKWLRAVRDESYERFKDLSPEEVIRITREESARFMKEVEESRKNKAQQKSQDLG